MPIHDPGPYGSLVTYLRQNILDYVIISVSPFFDMKVFEMSSHRIFRINFILWHWTIFISPQKNHWPKIVTKKALMWFLKNKYHKCWFRHFFFRQKSHWWLNTRWDRFKHHPLIFSDYHEKNISRKRLFVCFMSLILLESSKVLFLSLKS